MPRRQATWGGKAILSLLILTAISIIFVPYGIFIAIVTSLIIIHQLLLRVIFSGPKKRSLPFSDPGWDVISASNGGVDVYGFINLQNVKTDLVVFIHGWQSSSEKFVDRMNIFRNKGLHTLAIDMRGHGMAPDTDEWTAGKVIEDVKVILESIDKGKVDKVHFFGHSLGAFICLGLQHDRHTGWWKDNCSTIMLESPMVAYSPILEQMASRISFMMPLLKRWAVKGFNRIHPDVGGLVWNDIDIPKWGLPTVPTLLLQSANDSRLGRYHYDLLMEQDIELHPHLIESLTHSKNKINVERDELIRLWIDEMIL